MIQVAAISGLTMSRCIILLINFSCLTLVMAALVELAEDFDFVGYLELNLKNMVIAVELNKLLYRVAETYKNPSDYLKVLGGRFSCSVDEAMISKRRLWGVLKKYLEM